MHCLAELKQSRFSRLKYLSFYGPCISLLPPSCSLPYSIRNLKKDSCSAISLLYMAFQGLWRVIVMLLFIKITMLLEEMESKAYCEWGARPQWSEILLMLDRLSNNATHYSINSFYILFWSIFYSKPILKLNDLTQWKVVSSTHKNLRQIFLVGNC